MPRDPPVTRATVPLSESVAGPLKLLVLPSNTATFRHKMTFLGTNAYRGARSPETEPPRSSDRMAQGDVPDSVHFARYQPISLRTASGEIDTDTLMRNKHL